MGKYIAILAALFVAGTASAITLEVVINVKNDAGDTVIQTRTINVPTAHAVRVRDAFGGDIDGLKSELVQAIKNRVIQAEQQAVRDAKIQEMIAAEQAVAEPTVE